ncbi:MAG TPA: O-antigen ligase family protein [Candidatus Paceibacterota bacterium]|nr:O-antigen ligase family protein [Candidatus Paceibacterota bacterium]
MAKVTKYIVLGALFLVPFLPLYVANAQFFPFITGKGFLFRILVEIAFVGWVALAAMDKRYRPQFSWLLAIFGAFTLWIFIADLFAVNPHKALWSNFERMDGFVTLIHVFLFFAVMGAMLSVEKLWRKWWLVFLAVAGIVTLIGVMQMLCAGQACGAPGQFFAINQGGVRVDGRIGNAIYLAVYLMFAAFVAIWVAIESKGWLRYGLIVLSAFAVFILFNTATRGAIVGLVAGSALSALLFLVTSGGRGRKIAGGLLVALLILIGGFLLVKDNPAVAEHPVWGRIASISLKELEVRFTLWSMAAEGLTERPLTGYGQEGYNYIFNGYYRPALYTQEPWFDRAHSAYMDWLVAGGIPAFLLFVALLIAAFVLVLRTPNLSTATRIMLAGLIAAYAVQALVVFDNLLSYLPLAAVLAYLHSRAMRPIDALEKLPELPRGSAEAIVIPVAGAAILFLILTVNVPNMRGANHLVYAISSSSGGPAANLERFRAALATHTFATQEVREQFVNFTVSLIGQPGVPDQLKNDFAMLAITEIEKEVERAPADARVRMQAALLHRAVGNYPQALAHLAAARAASPNRQLIMLEQGVLLAEVGEQEAARAVLEEAYALLPGNKDLAARVAAGLITAGADLRAEEILMEAHGARIVDHDVLVNAYAITKQYGKLIETVMLQVKNRPDAPEARYRLAAAYALAGEYQKARVEAQTAMAKFPATVAQGQSFIASLPTQ